MSNRGYGSRSGKNRSTRGYDIPDAPQRQRRSNRGSDDYYGRQEEDQIPNRSRGDQKQQRRDDSRWIEHDDRNLDSRSRIVDEYHDDRQPGTWECLECGIWNYPDEERCHRCRAYAEDMYSHHAGRYPEDSTDSRWEEDRTDRYEDEEVDEFGRKKLPAGEKKKQREWPPCFDKEGGAFVFDSRSGMFYEELSDFFYNPTNKLYYGNKKKAYYRYKEDKNPPFEEVTKVDGSQGNEGSTSKSSDLEPVLGVVGAKSKKTGPISINLKTKKLPKKTQPKKPNPVAAPLESSSNPHKRQHQVDMSKWSERQVELKEGSKEEKKQEVGLEEPATKKRRQVPRTAKGEPICALCQRKFPNMDKLIHHERVSKLHAENLKKNERASAEKPASNESPAKFYVDRAKQRRDMYSSSDGSSRVAVAVMTSDADANPTASREVEATELVRPEDTLGKTNVGNQMLQKLGWKSGQSLGRRSDEAADTTESNLKKDWKRIESLAGSQR